MQFVSEIIVYPHVNPISLLWRQFGSESWKRLKAIILAEAILLDQFWMVFYITSPNIVLFEQLFVSDKLPCVTSYMLCFLRQPRQKLTKIINQIPSRLMFVEACVPFFSQVGI